MSGMVTEAAASGGPRLGGPERVATRPAGRCSPPTVFHDVNPTSRVAQVECPSGGVGRSGHGLERGVEALAEPCCAAAVVTRVRR
ncbi:MAG: hypothetical protein WB441_14555 [Nocardioidaceae bacterium]